MQKSIAVSIEAIYGNTKVKVHSWSDLLFGLLIMLGGTWGMIVLIQEGKYLWSLFPFAFIVLGSGGVMNAFDPED